jgi:hypothetical protein
MRRVAKEGRKNQTRPLTPIAPGANRKKRRGRRSLALPGMTCFAMEGRPGAVGPSKAKWILGLRESAGTKIQKDGN